MSTLFGDRTITGPGSVPGQRDRRFFFSALYALAAALVIAIAAWKHWAFFTGSTSGELMLAILLIIGLSVLALWGRVLTGRTASNTSLQLSTLVLLGVLLLSFLI